MKGSTVAFSISSISQTPNGQALASTQDLVINLTAATPDSRIDLPATLTLSAYQTIATEVTDNTS